jgi:hypothetical protein
LTPLDLLAHLRRRPRPTETRPDDHHVAAPATPAPATTPRTIRVAPKPPQPSPPRETHARPPRRTWLNAEYTDVEKYREDRVTARLARLTDQLGSPLAAAQAEFAPHLRKDTHA